MCQRSRTTHRIHVGGSLLIGVRPFIRFHGSPNQYHDFYNDKAKLHFPLDRIFFPTFDFKTETHSTYPKQFSKSLKPLSFSLNSVYISKEDKPNSDSEQIDPPLQVPSTSSEESDTFDKRQLEEKFAVLNTGIYECCSCAYKYNEALGEPVYPFPPGFQFNKLSDDWRCPTCGFAKNFFGNKSVEIAGFAENQQFVLGGNSLTSNQKALLIWKLNVLLCTFLVWLLSAIVNQHKCHLVGGS